MSKPFTGIYKITLTGKLYHIDDRTMFATGKAIPRVAFLIDGHTRIFVRMEWIHTPVHLISNRAYPKCDLKNLVMDVVKSKVDPFCHNLLQNPIGLDC